MKSHVINNRHYLECICADSSKILVFDIDEWRNNDGDGCGEFDVSAYFTQPSYIKFRYRLKYGLINFFNYVFRNKNYIIGDFEIIFSEQNYIQLVDLVNSLKKVKGNLKTKDVEKYPNKVNYAKEKK